VHVVLPIWLVPLSLTVLIWAGAIFWPSANDGVSYSCAPSCWRWFALRPPLPPRFLVWLAYFIWLVVAGGA
jgi:hypothetical protein